jgi:hypothetical protein
MRQLVSSSLELGGLHIKSFTYHLACRKYQLHFVLKSVTIRRIRYFEISILMSVWNVHLVGKHAFEEIQLWKPSKQSPSFCFHDPCLWVVTPHTVPSTLCHGWSRWSQTITEVMVCHFWTYSIKDLAATILVIHIFSLSTCFGGIQLPCHQLLHWEVPCGEVQMVGFLLTTV